MTVDDPMRELAADPYGAYERLRETAPVHRIVGPDGLPAWIVTRYEDVRHALADARLSLDKRHALPGHYQGVMLPPVLEANLLNMDPPDHTRIRRLISGAFTVRRVEELREPVRRIADELLDAMAENDRADLVAAYAAPLPIRVVCELLGVPTESLGDFRVWMDRLLMPDSARPERAAEAMDSLVVFFTGLIAHKRAHPGDDLISALIEARDEPDEQGGDRLSEDELTSLVFLILFAGYENTVHLVGSAVLTLFRHPARLDALRSDPAGIPAAVEESARYEGPGLLALRRFAKEDVTIAGTTVPAGETVLLSLSSANRDPGRFPDPDRFDPGRDTSGHLALGHGIHYCLGAPLARLEAEVALAALLERFPKLALDVPESELRWRPSLRSRGLLALPVRY